MCTDDGVEVMVWVGLDASPGERQQALHRAVNYLKAFKRALDAPISRIIQHGENGTYP